LKTGRRSFTTAISSNKVTPTIQWYNSEGIVLSFLLMPMCRREWTPQMATMRSVAVVVLSWLVLALALPECRAAATSLRHGPVESSEMTMEERGLAAKYYHTVSSTNLGGPNPDAAIGNPLKGLVESPIYTNPPYTSKIPLAVEFYYIGMWSGVLVVIVIVDTRS
jgi:hypothetical protein